MKKDRLLLFALFVFFIFSFFATSKIMLFSAYILVSIIFYLAIGSIVKSLFLGLILSLFAEFGLGGSLFLMGPKELDLGSGWWFSPFTMMLGLTLLLLLADRKNLDKITEARNSDYFIAGFFLTCFLNVLIFPYFETFLGLLGVFEALLLYFLSRIIIDKKDIKYIGYIFAAIIIFQSLISIMQYFRGGPVGKVIETVNVESPYGITAVEEENISRSMGTFGHPNIAVAMLLGLMPFLIANNSFLAAVIFIFGLTGVFLTFSRVGWSFGIVLFLYWVNEKIKISPLNINKKKKILLTSLSFFALSGIIIFPLIETRIATLYQAFEYTGSMGVRFALFREAEALINTSPLAGVGLNRSVIEYSRTPVTEIFNYIKVSGFYRIHNMFLEIASEVGIPGMVFLTAGLISSILSALKSKSNVIRKGVILGLIGVIWVSMFNPFFHTTPFRLIMLLTALNLSK